MINLSNESLEQLLSFYEARIEALERELKRETFRANNLGDLLARTEDQTTLDYNMTTTNWINSKLNG